MNDLGDAIGWPIHDREWLTKIVVMSLVTIIPIVGSIVVLGWMLAALDNLRQNRRQLPPIGFTYIGRGFPLFVVSLVYTLAVVVVAGIVVLISALIAASGGQDNTAAGVVAGIGFLLAVAIAVVGFLASLYISPALILETDRGGVAAGLNLGGVIRVARQRPEATLAAALSLLVAYLLGSLGGFVCGLGIYLTIAYGYAVAAAAVRRYELELAPPAPTQVPAPPAPH
jgi:hypothetical protein